MRFKSSTVRSPPTLRVLTVDAGSRVKRIALPLVIAIEPEHPRYGKGDSNSKSNITPE